MVFKTQHQVVLGVAATLAALIISLLSFKILRAMTVLKPPLGYNSALQYLNLYLSELCGVPGIEFLKLIKCPIPGPREP